MNMLIFTIVMIVSALLSSDNPLGLASALIVLAFGWGFWLGWYAYKR